MSNQTQIPYTQSPDGVLNLVQQYVNKVFRNINNQLNDVQASVAQMNILGEIKFSPLTLSQFQAQAGDTWIEANGQSCVGTKYASQYGLNTVPTVSVSGCTAYIKVD